MPRFKAPVYREKGAEPLKNELEQLRKVCDELAGSIPEDVWVQLNSALEAVEAAAKAVVPISRGGTGSVLGYGVDQAKKAIACDQAIALLRNIRQAKGW